MFVPPASIHFPFLNNENFFDEFSYDTPKLYCGHLQFFPTIAVATRPAKILTLVRDPYDNAISHARFFFSDALRLQSKLGSYIAAHGMTLDEVMPFSIAGTIFEGETWHSVYDRYVLYALGWAKTTQMIKYETLLKHASILSTNEARSYFADLLAKLELEMPEDWEARVVTGADRKMSATSSHLFKVPQDRKYLTESEKALFAASASQIREILGYYSKSS